MRMELAGHLRSRRQESSGKQFFPEQVQSGKDAVPSVSSVPGWVVYWWGVFL